MSLILGKYKSKRKLGKGAYGDVLLAEDPDGKQIAIKMINKKIIQKDPYLEEYLEGEKDVMMSVKSKYIMELYAFEEDDNYKYFICEYCDGGDLLNYQAKQPNKAFDLKLATQILSEVIKGLELLHAKGYLHRDIKPQNILLKKLEKQNKYLYKLADFGFAKKNQDVGGTVLGTEHYMSPQIYLNQVYSFEVDMWAFAVLFYFMLNLQFPFKINAHAQLEQKREELIKQCKDFSYREAVKKSKKNIQENCTNQMEDLFKKMLHPDGHKRINFVEIREHPVFKELFPVIESQSRILYKSKKLNRYDTFLQGVRSGINQPAKKKQTNVKKNDENVENATPDVHIKRMKTVEEKACLQGQLDNIIFLSQLSDYLSTQLTFIQPFELLALRYNLLKYYVVLIRQFYYDLKFDLLEKKYPKLKWKQFLKSQEFNSFKSEVKQKLDQGEMKVSQSYDDCKPNLLKIKQTNQYFQSALESEVTANELNGTFKNSYRGSTGAVFEKVREKFSSGNKFAYLTALVIICHGFKQIYYSDQEDLRELFSSFVTQKKIQPGKNIDLSQLKSWMSTSSKESIKQVIKKIVGTYFS